MASQIQRVEYEGYLAEDPELHYTATGKSVANFRIGSNRQYKNADGEVVKETTWLKITAWGNLGEIVHKYCAKGSWVVVEGVLRNGVNGSPKPYQLKSGEWAAAHEVTANAVRILRGRDMGDTAETTDTPSSAPVDSGDAPF